MQEKKKKKSLCFCELNVPKHNLIRCCSHKDTHRLLIVKLQKQNRKLDCDSMTTAVKCGNMILLQFKMTLQSPWNTVSSVFGVTAIPILTAEYSNLPLRHQKGQTSTFITANETRS